MNKQVTAGGSIEARCTRCRTVMNHTIVAMVGERVVRVECNTCHGTHNYLPVKTAKGPVGAKAGQKKMTAPRKAKVTPETIARAEWAAQQPTMDPEQAIPYDMSGKYLVKNLLLHPFFGLGIVQFVLPPNKIQVLFQEGKKLLRCG